MLSRPDSSLALRPTRPRHRVQAYITDDMRDVVSASADGVVRVFDLHIGSVTTELSNKTKAPLTHLQPAGSRRVVTLSQRCREAAVWDLQEGKCALKLTGAMDCLTCLHVHPKVPLPLCHGRCG